MTREEAIARIKDHKIVHKIDEQPRAIYISEALDMAIKALEQQPCEDCISRQAAQAKIKNICDEYRLSYEDGERKAATGGSAYALGHAFDDLPPVTPQQKIGYWTKQEDGTYKCSNCEKYELWEGIYCASCGARMTELESS